MDGKAPENVKQGYFAQSTSHVDTLRVYITETLPKYLPEEGFVGGERPGEDDFHIAGWLTRIAATTGVQSGGEAMEYLKQYLGVDVPVKVVAYWDAWLGRPSWKEVYAAGLH